MTAATKEAERYDFRWGVPWLDEARRGGADVPGFILRNYAEVGVTPIQMMTIIHLAAYHYNSEQGESKPSLHTVAVMMGYKKDDYIRTLVKGLEKKALVSIKRVPGKTSVYDFSAFAEQCLNIDLERRRGSENKPASSLREEVPPNQGVPSDQEGHVPPNPGGPVPPNWGDEDIEVKNKNKRSSSVESEIRNKPGYADLEAATAAALKRQLEGGEQKSGGMPTVDDTPAPAPDPLKVLTALYENNLGLITKGVADFLKDAADTYPVSWFQPAITEALKNGVRKWSYVETILQRWSVEGFDGGPKQPAAPAAPTRKLEQVKQPRKECDTCHGAGVVVPSNVPDDHPMHGVSVPCPACLAAEKAVSHGA